MKNMLILTKKDNRTNIFSVEEKDDLWMLLDEESHLRWILPVSSYKGIIDYFKDDLDNNVWDKVCIKKINLT